MYHTSPQRIEPGMIDEFGVAGSCLFFSNSVYVMTGADTVYIYEADFRCISVHELHDSDIISDISERFNVDAEIAESLLDSSKEAWDFGANGDDVWWLQGKRGECAVKMGYDGCKDRDEQGTVFIIPMQGRENELKLINVCSKNSLDAYLRDIIE